MKAFSITAFPSPATIPIESFDNILVIANIKNFNPSLFKILSISTSSFSFLSRSSASFTVFTCATPIFEPSTSNIFMSIFINSDSDFPPKAVPAFSISSPYSSTFTPAISASSFPAFTSHPVHVGDLNSNVSETIALNISPAVVGEGRRLFSLKSLSIIVAVHPTGSILTYRGSSTLKFDIL